MFGTQFEVKTITLKGLHAKNHTGILNDLRNQGWHTVAATPDIKHMQINYNLKRDRGSLSG